jgi:hypothetical protein
MKELKNSTRIYAQNMVMTSNQSYDIKMRGQEAFPNPEI